MHVYSGRVEIAGQTFSLGVMIRETNQGTFHYDLTKIDTASEGAEGRSSRTDGDFPTTPAGSTLDTLNLFEVDDEFNVSNADAAASTVDPDALRERLRGLGLSDKVVLHIVDSLKGAAGDFASDGSP